MEKPLRFSDGRISLAELIEPVVNSLQKSLDVRWRDARAIEIVLAEIAEQFDGEDPMKPRTREALERAKETLLHVNRQLEVYEKAPELKDPSPEEMDDIRGLVERAVS